LAWSFWFLGLAALSGVAAGSVGCGDRSGDPPRSCSAPRPAFSLTIRPAKATDALPASTRLKVTFGSGEEEIDLSNPPIAPQAVFCSVDVHDDDQGLVDAGAAPDRPLDSVRCQLWTDGAAMVHVEADGFAPADRELEADTDDCGVTTTAAEILLSDSD
jgi:hypothetical protein